MNGTELLANAPLIEVIAEIHWALPVGAADQGGHDPFWFPFANRFATWARSEGYAHIEQLVPAGVTVPLDMVGRAPILRLRPEPGTWPLLQIGQSLLTVNAVPPYDGWHCAIAPRLAKAIAAFIGARHGLQAMPIEKLELHYMDAFTEKHGVTDALDYLGRELGLLPACPPQWLRIAGSGNISGFSGEYRFELDALPGSTAIAKYGPGTVNVPGAEQESTAALFDFMVVSKPNTELSKDAVLSWFESAHSITQSLFEAALSDRVRSIVRQR